MLGIYDEFLKAISEMEMDEKKLSPLELFLSLEKLKWQVDRIMADDESEQGTISRATKALKEDIEELEQKMNIVLYDPKNGLILVVDRLQQEKIHRENIMKNIYALWIVVIAAVLKIIGDWIFKK